MSKTTDELLEAVAARGLRVANLFQLELSTIPPTFCWQANLTDGLQYWGFHRGATPQQALSGALFKSSTETGERAIVPKRTPTPPPVHVPSTKPEAPTPTSPLMI